METNQVMQKLTDRDKRTIRFGAVAIAVYLVLFFGVRGYRHLEATRAEYHQLLQKAETTSLQLQSYETKALVAAKLKENFQANLSNQSKAALVGEVNAAIQKAAQTSGVQLGPIRESPGRASAEEHGAMQVEGSGPVPSVMQLLHRLEGLGYPLIVDSIQIVPDTKKPGAIQLTVHLVILDFERWKEEEKRDA